MEGKKRELEVREGERKERKAVWRGMEKSWKGAGGMGAGWEVSYKGENGSGRDSDKEGCYRIREGN